jgi:DNA-binding PadR family transcriptional regulator
MSKTLPPVTHLQFLVLEALAEREQSGRDLRALLAGYGVRNSGPAFYQMMGRLEDAALVEGWYEQKLVAGQNIKERRYRQTPAAARAVQETRAFYAAKAGAAARMVKRGSHA